MSKTKVVIVIFVICLSICVLWLFHIGSDKNAIIAECDKFVSFVENYSNKSEDPDEMDDWWVHQCVNKYDIKNISYEIGKISPVVQSAYYVYITWYIDIPDSGWISSEIKENMFDMVEDVLRFNDTLRSEGIEVFHPNESIKVIVNDSEEYTDRDKYGHIDTSSKKYDYITNPDGTRTWYETGNSHIVKID